MVDPLPARTETGVFCNHWCPYFDDGRCGLVDEQVPPDETCIGVDDSLTTLRLVREVQELRAALKRWGAWAHDEDGDPDERLFDAACRGMPDWARPGEVG